MHGFALYIKIGSWTKDAIPVVLGHFLPESIDLRDDDSNRLLVFRLR